MAGAYKYLLIAGIVVGGAAGTIAALSRDNAGSTSDSPGAPAGAGSGVDRLQRAHTLYEQGQVKMYAGELLAAIDLMRQALALDRDPKYMLGLGIALASNEELDESVRIIEEALTRSTDQVLRQKAATRLKALVPECLTPSGPCPLKRQTIATIQAITVPAEQAAKAAAANEAGKDKLFAGDWEGASELFREAIARAPDPKYFFNLGNSLFQEGKFDESLVAVNAVFKSNPTDRQREQSLKLSRTILAECQAQNLTCHVPAALAQILAKTPP